MDHFHTIVIDGKDGGEDRWILMNTGQTERSEQLRRGETRPDPNFWRERLQQQLCSPAEIHGREFPAVADLSQDD